MVFIQKFDVKLLLLLIFFFVATVIIGISCTIIYNMMTISPEESDLNMTIIWTSDYNHNEAIVPNIWIPPNENNSFKNQCEGKNYTNVTTQEDPDIKRSEE